MTSKTKAGFVIATLLATGLSLTSIPFTVNKHQKIIAEAKSDSAKAVKATATKLWNTTLAREIQKVSNARDISTWGTNNAGLLNNPMISDFSEARFGGFTPASAQKFIQNYEEVIRQLEDFKDTPEFDDKTNPLTLNHPRYLKQVMITSQPSHQNVNRALDNLSLFDLIPTQKVDIKSDTIRLIMGHIDVCNPNTWKKNGEEYTCPRGEFTTIPLKRSGADRLAQAVEELKEETKQAARNLEETDHISLDLVGGLVEDPFLKNCNDYEKFEFTDENARNGTQDTYNLNGLSQSGRRRHLEARTRVKDELYEAVQDGYDGDFEAKRTELESSESVLMSAKALSEAREKLRVASSYDWTKKTRRNWFFRKVEESEDPLTGELVDPEEVEPRKARYEKARLTASELIENGASGYHHVGDTINELIEPTN